MSLTVRQMMERIEQLRYKREIIVKIQEWIKKNFTGAPGDDGKVIPADVIDEVLVDIDAELLAKTDEEIGQLENMEVGDGRKQKGKDPKTQGKKRSGKKAKAS